MRVWHCAFLVLVSAVGIRLSQDAVGRVAIIVFLGLGLTMAVATASILMLFRSIGAIGEAKGALAHIEAISQAILVLVVSSGLMGGLLTITWISVRTWVK